MSTQSLAGKRVAITGATSGIGLALAKRLALENCRVLAHGRDQSKLDKLRSEISTIATFQADVREANFAMNFMDAAIKQLDHCDVVVNNAGTIWAGAVDRAKPELISELVSTNVEAPFQVTHRAITYFKSRDAGHLINITSVLGIKTRIYSGIYAGTKHALEALSDSLRQELARTPVQISCIEPGMTLSELHRGFKEHPMKAMGIENPLRPDDVVNAIIFAMSQRSNAAVTNIVPLPRDQKT